jgi:hypothetical protein
MKQFFALHLKLFKFMIKYFHIKEIKLILIWKINKLNKAHFKF